MTITENRVKANNSVVTQGNNNNTVLDSPDAIVGSTIQLPATVSEELFSSILEMLEKFLESKQAGKLEYDSIKTLQTEITEARKQGHKKGWGRLREFLSDTANIATIGTAIGAFLAAHPGIPQAIASLFTR